MVEVKERDIATLVAGLQEGEFSSVGIDRGLP